MDGVREAKCVDKETEAWAPSALIWRVTMDPEFAGVNFLSPSFEKQSTLESDLSGGLITVFECSLSSPEERHVRHGRVFTVPGPDSSPVIAEVGEAGSQPVFYEEKCWAGWVTSWNQDRREKHQQPLMCR